MSAPSPFAAFSPTTIADVVGRGCAMDIGIRPLWPGMARVAGPAFPVRCPPADNLMLHAAIYRAPAGAILVCKAGDVDHAMAGGNVCAIAQRRGIAGLVVDGVVRDVAETRERGFPVFARGLSPIPGGKESLDLFNEPVVCGGVTVSPGDIVVADEEGIVVVPAAIANDVLAKARARVEKEAAQSLDAWEAEHRARVDAALHKKGFAG